jgi:hypothetical protein
VLSPCTSLRLPHLVLSSTSAVSNPKGHNVPLVNQMSDVVDLTIDSPDKDVLSVMRWKLRPHHVPPVLVSPVAGPLHLSLVVAKRSRSDISNNRSSLSSLSDEDSKEDNGNRHNGTALYSMSHNIPFRFADPADYPRVPGGFASVFKVIHYIGVELGMYKEEVPAL